MHVSGKALFFSARVEDFESKGKTINFQRVVIMPDGDDDTLSLTAPADLDLSGFKKLQPVLVTLNVYKDFKGYLKAKIVGMQA